LRRAPNPDPATKIKISDEQLSLVLENGKLPEHTCYDHSEWQVLSRSTTAYVRENEAGTSASVTTQKFEPYRRLIEDLDNQAYQQLHYFKPWADKFIKRHFIASILQMIAKKQIPPAEQLRIFDICQHSKTANYQRLGCQSPALAAGFFRAKKSAVATARYRDFSESDLLSVVPNGPSG
jgi:hypothetical protein